MSDPQRTRDLIEQLKESIRLDGIDLEKARPEDKPGILQHMGFCAKELAALADELRGRNA